MTEKSILCSMGRIFRSMDKVWQRVGASEEMTLPEIQVDHDFIENCFQRLSEFQDKLEELESTEETLYVDAIDIYLKLKAHLKGKELLITKASGQSKNLQTSMSELVCQQKFFSRRNEGCS